MAPDSRVDLVPLDQKNSDCEKDDAPMKETYQNQSEFFLSCLGYCVGLGCIWRFPYISLKNGGGQFHSKRPIDLWNMFPIARGIGYGMVIVSGLACVTYNVIIAWCFFYIFHSFDSTLPWTNCDNAFNTPKCFIPGAANSTTAAVNSTKFSSPSDEFFHNYMLNISDGIHNIGPIQWKLAGCLLLAWVLVFLCMFKGVTTSGKVAYVTATMPYFLFFALLIQGILLNGSDVGFLYYVTPDFERLLDIQVWVDACFQVFYSLGPAWGGLITMASFNKFDNNCSRDALLIPIANAFTYIFAGSVIFLYLGHISVEMNVPIDEAVALGPGAAFVVYSSALAMLPLPQLWSVLFFLNTVLLGIDSQFGMFETLTACVHDLAVSSPSTPKILRSKPVITCVLALVEFCVGLAFVTRGGMFIFQLWDWFSAAFSVTLFGLVECLVIAWIYKVDKLSSDVQEMTGSHIWSMWRPLWKFVCPSLLFVLLCFSVFKFTMPTYRGYAYPAWAIGFGWTLSSLSLLPLPICILIYFRTNGNSFEGILGTVYDTTSISSSTKSNPVDGDASPDDILLPDKANIK